jgi:hypothetical protein
MAIVGISSILLPVCKDVHYTDICPSCYFRSGFGKLFMSVYNEIKNNSTLSELFHNLVVKSL